jgi:P-type Ca2+ transporter type 2C
MVIAPPAGFDLRLLRADFVEFPMLTLDAKQAWHAVAVNDVAAELEADADRGLRSSEAAARLATFGRNEIRAGKAVSRWAILRAQFSSVVIWILIAAAVISALLGEMLDAVVIAAIVALNAAIGFLQEYRAEQAVAALARLAAPLARVVRDGEARVVAAAEVVPGDLLLLEAGDLVAADARLAEASALRANEAALTGESVSVEKSTGLCPPETVLPDRTNMVFSGTSVVAGSGRALAIATGMETEFGKIAQMLEAAPATRTPLQRKLDQVGRRLLWASLAIVAVVFGLGLMRSVAPFEMFLSAVSLAVAAIPEGLPAVVTIALALGVSRMVARNALVRRLHSVETLGSAQVICTDKTGTLTMGQMTARRVVTAAGPLTVSGEGYVTEGAIFDGGEERNIGNDSLLADLLTAAAACNDAHLVSRDGAAAVVGDPTEGALLVLAVKGGIDLSAIEREMPRIAALPFSSERKLMTVIRRIGDGTRAFVKGAPEVVLQRATHIRCAEGKRALTDSDRSATLQATALMAGEALRVIACADRAVDSGEINGAGADSDQIENGLTLLGLVGLQDPPRGEARDAVRRCRQAGIRTVMITGDHADTARAIARELEILRHGDEVMEGAELAKLSDDDLAARVRSVAVYARVTAEHKLRIVRAWKSQGAVVAMTGDGVNDAPALKEASIGIAMGLTGTEVTKEAADVVITDDNFASIVAAVEEGRGIYDNIAKTLAYLLSGNTGELIVMLVAALAGRPLPLLPTQLLWINLVTDGLPALALATDPIDPDVLSRPPRPPESQILDREMISLVVLTGCLTATVALVAFVSELRIGVESARSAAFFVLVVAELLRSFGARSPVRTIWEIGVFSNLRLFAVVVASFALQLLISQVHIFGVIFETEPVSLVQCLWRIGLGAVPLMVLQAVKIARRRRRLLE